MATAKQVDFLVSGVVDASGNQLNAGRVYFYETDGVTLKTIWEDGNKAEASPNPVTLSTVGTASIYADGTYDIVVRDSDDNTIRSHPDITYKVEGSVTDSFIDAEDFGTGDDANAISLAITSAAGSDRTILLRPKSWDIDADLTVPSNINLKLEFGAYCTIAAAQTLTINGTIESPLYNIFRGSGTVTFDDRNFFIPSVWESGTHDNATINGLITFNDGLVVQGTNNLPITIQRTEDGVGTELLRLDRLSASVADNDYYDLTFFAENDNNQNEERGRIRVTQTDVSDGTEKTQLKIALADGVDGSVDDCITVDVDSITLNADLVLSGDITSYEAVNDANPEIRVGSSDAEELHIQTVYDTGAQTLDYVLFQTDAASAVADKGLFRFNVDGTNILDIDDGGLEVTGGLSLTGDALAYVASNDGNPQFRIGATDAEELHIQTVYDTGGQTLDYVLFQTDVASATANKGLFRFNVDGTNILDVDDGGIEVTGTVSSTFNDDSASAQAYLFSRTTESPANDDAFYITYEHENNNNEQVEIARQTITMKTVADGSEQGEWKIGVANSTDGALDDIFSATQDGLKSIKGYIDFDNSGTFLQLKLVPVTDWDMDAGGKNVTHGLTLANIRWMGPPLIRNDAATTYNIPDHDELTVGNLTSTTVSLQRKFGGIYDSTDYDSTGGYVRGWLPFLIESA